MDTFDVLAAEIAELTRRLDEAKTAARASSVEHRSDREDDLRALRNFIALAPYANPECLPLFPRWTNRQPRRAPPTPPSGIPYPRRPTDAV